MAIEFTEQEQVQRELLCDILGQLGGDSAVCYLNEMPVGQLRSEVYSHVCWLEQRAKVEVLFNQLKTADLLSKDELENLLKCNTDEQEKVNLLFLQVKMQNMLQLAKASMHP